MTLAIKLIFLIYIKFSLNDLDDFDARKKVLVKIDSYQKIEYLNGQLLNLLGFQLEILGGIQVNDTEHAELNEINLKYIKCAELAEPAESSYIC